MFDLKTTIVAALLTAGIIANDLRAGQPLQQVHFQTLKVDGFWKTQFKRLTEQWIPHCIKQMEAGGQGQELLNLVNTGKALRGEPHGEFTGLPWSDAYVYNTVESICLALETDPAGDTELAEAQSRLRAKLQEWLPIILAAQCDDGYIHSFHILNEHPRYSNIGWHEFYVQGYFIEMGVSHYRVTGGADTRLYDAAHRCADQLCKNFGPQSDRRWFHGHPGMGYALCRLARLVNEVDEAGGGDKYDQLAKHLLDTRYDFPEYRNPYHQSHLPVTEMTEAVGHAVRATYFYTAMADLAMLTGDQAYAAAVDKIWSNAIDRKHYITGGVGASHQGEAFAADFDLRNNGYCESCAGCGMTFWADRMFRMHAAAHPIDVQERTLYNNILGAIELSGENFFYQNPLASRTARYSWHACPCCVGNIPRALLGLKDLMYALNPERNVLYINHFIASEGLIDDVAGSSLGVAQQTDYPWDGTVSVSLQPQQPTEFTVKIRIPDRTESPLYSAEPEIQDRYRISVNGESIATTVEDGYVQLQRRWSPGDTIRLELPMDVQRIRCDRRVSADRGRVAIIRGPLVYNVENVDHDVDVRDLVLPPESKLNERRNPDLLGGVVVIEAAAKAREDDHLIDTTLRAIPNFVRLNRGGWSQVWITEDPEKVVEPESEDALNVKPIVRKSLDKRTIDRVVIGDSNSEKQHHLRGQRTESGVFQNMRWRDARNGWFSYELVVKPNAENVLLSTYWGSDVGNRRFRILVDDQQIASQTLDQNDPNKFFDVEYPIPGKLIGGKNKVIVKLQAEDGAMAGGIFDLRIVCPDEQN